MATMNVTIEEVQVNSRAFGSFEGDECVSHQYFTHTMSFRIYPLPTFTGVCANGRYERLLGVTVYDHLKHWYPKGDYKVGRLREGMSRCPDGYTCKYYEIPVRVKTSKRTKDKVIWIDCQ